MGANAVAKTWTCWKAVVGDESDAAEPVALKDLLAHPSVRNYTIKAQTATYIHVEVTNQKGETFDIKPVDLGDGKMALHATSR